ncbi:MAG: hypothetical protein ACRENM_08980 [Candidatus Dormibacteraceae bacterium]
MSQNRLAASVVGLGSGLAGFVLLLLAGLLLYQRLWGDSIGALVAILVVFGGFGAYGGFLLGLLAFSAIRGTTPEADSRPET